MTEKETIHKTEFIDKQLPKIIYEKQTRVGTCDIKSEYISVSDKTSELALKTLEKVKKLGD